MSFFVFTRGQLSNHNTIRCTHIKVRRNNDDFLTLTLTPLFNHNDTSVAPYGSDAAML